MPIYVYKCAACGDVIEKLQKMSEDALVICPTCAKPELQKQLTSSGFALKGNGWYVTDHKNAGTPQSKWKKNPDS